MESLSEFGKACILMRLCARPPVREGEADSFRSAASMRALAILFCTVNTRFFGVEAYDITNHAMPLRLHGFEMPGRAIEDFYVPLL